jgi:hypothetical protein
MAVFMLAALHAGGQDVFARLIIHKPLNTLERLTGGASQISTLPQKYAKDDICSPFACFEIQGE